ncbi:TauD/TfdA family dioxygenase [Kitasatospora sp. MAP5-34]|uniref:TauD/TfdA family dioxygenase n=1 Tax=Kitasatospora sp. MAP5-34 TaxID=3035102 RepID=UPI0024761094|nr:TauD/TfdA family dioxygenase [Kitasatospora sp. MAP5-34]MDH6576655.1 L-asparagine oxygenase [Kitasatospora sp. MAP5-34]
MSTVIRELAITAEESGQIRTHLDAIMADDRMPDPNYFVEHSHVLAQELPRRVREAFYTFGRCEVTSALHVTGNPVLRDGPGPTPVTYVEEEPGYRLNDAQILHGLYGSLLGEPVGFTSQRKGSIFNTITPMPSLSGVANSSSGSMFDFGFHIEDAFHPTRAEFIGLACMRNDERAATTISNVDGVELTEEELDALFEPQFVIGHNPIHSTSGVISEEKLSVFFGPRERPYVRINFATLKVEDYDGVPRRALEKVRQHFEDNRAQLVLQAGDFVYIDNFRCAHARDAFDPLPPGKARWLSRVVFATDLRKSRELRGSTVTRAIAA